MPAVVKKPKVPKEPTYTVTADNLVGFTRGDVVTGSDLGGAERARQLVVGETVEAN